MINKVKFVSEAASEFRDSVKWYNTKADNLSFIFTHEIDVAIERIKSNPCLYPIAVENIRKIQVNIFPYSIFYKIDKDVLVVLRIFHNQRKPIE